MLTVSADILIFVVVYDVQYISFTLILGHLFVSFGESLTNYQCKI